MPSGVVTAWTAVVPIKRFEDAKSRMADVGVDRVELAQAIALDTLAAVGATSGVVAIVVVTDGAVFAAGDLPTSASVVTQTSAGLNGAIRDGIDAACAAAPERGVVVLLGDLPALVPADLAAVLESAAAHPLGVVPDASGTGTAMITALPGMAISPAFGPASAARHAAQGHVPLAASPAARQDVDTAADLAAALALGVGTRTAALFT